MIDITEPPYRCVGDGLTDNTEALDRVFLQNGPGRLFHAPAGHYLTRGGHRISKLGQSLVGDGISITRFTVTDPDRSGFQLVCEGTWPPVLADVRLRDFTLDRRGHPNVGGVGIDCRRPAYRLKLEGLLIEGHQHGLMLGNTDYSILRDVIVQNSKGAGVLASNTPEDGACQYSFEHCLFQRNGGSGYAFVSVDGPKSVSLGEFVNVSTYANSHAGLKFVGSVATPIFGVRIVGGFFGEDGQAELVLETYGGHHKVVGSSLELAGSAFTGPDVSAEHADSGHPPTHTAPGIVLSAYERDVLLQGLRINGVSGEGIVTGAQLATINGCNISNSGLGNVVAEGSCGIRIVDGRALVMGNTLFNFPGSTDQAFGILLDGGHAMPDDFRRLNAFSDNAVAPVFDRARSGRYRATGRHTIVEELRAARPSLRATFLK